MCIVSTAEQSDAQVTLVVPPEVAAAVNARVESGEYANQGEVVRNGLRLLTEEDYLLSDPAVERWLREVVVPVAEATRADPPARSQPTKYGPASSRGAPLAHDEAAALFAGSPRPA